MPFFFQPPLITYNVAVDTNALLRNCFDFYRTVSIFIDENYLITIH